LKRVGRGGGGRKCIKIPKFLIRKYFDLQRTLSKLKLEILPVLIDPIITFYLSNGSLRRSRRFYSLQQTSISGRDVFQMWNSQMPHARATSRAFVLSSYVCLQLYDFSFYILWYMRSDDGCLVEPKHVAAIGVAIKICVSTDSVVISSYLKFVGIYFLMVFCLSTP